MHINDISLNSSYYGNVADKSCVMRSWLDTDREDRRTWTKTSPSSTLSTSNLTRDGLGL